MLDLNFDSRDISQKFGSEEKVDAWFSAKTRGLNDWQKEALREHWGTMQIGFEFALADGAGGRG